MEVPAIQHLAKLHGSGEKKYGKDPAVRSDGGRVIRSTKDFGEDARFGQPGGSCLRKGAIIPDSIDGPNECFRISGSKDHKGSG